MFYTQDATDLVKELGITPEAIQATNACADGYVKHAQSMVNANLWTKGQANDYLLGMQAHRLYEDINTLINQFNKR